jgi:hypothetical protein
LSRHRHLESADGRPDVPHAFPIEITLEINSLTRRLNLRLQRRIALATERNEGLRFRSGTSSSPFSPSLHKNNAACLLPAATAVSLNWRHANEVPENPSRNNDTANI